MHLWHLSSAVFFLATRPFCTRQIDVSADPLINNLFRRGLDRSSNSQFRHTRCRSRRGSGETETESETDAARGRIRDTDTPPPEQLVDLQVNLLTAVLVRQSRTSEEGTTERMFRDVPRSVRVSPLPWRETVVEIVIIRISVTPRPGGRGSDRSYP